MTEHLEFVEIQGSGEEAVFTAEQMSQMLTLATKGVKEIVELQKSAIADADKAEPGALEDLAANFAK